jgi:hypothetical protein
MKDTDHALVRIDAIGQVRPAAHVFRLADGVAWLEPAYLDPNGATMRTFHRIDGKVRDKGQGFTVDAGDKVAEVQPLSANPQDDSGGTCRRALAEYGDLLVDKGITQEAERARVALLLADDLAPSTA